MKKRKLLMPILGIATSISAVAIPSLTLTSCGCSPKIQDVLSLFRNPNGDLCVGGFRDDASEAKIKKFFGDTLWIPKEATCIMPYAFVNKKTMETTIPSFIKNFKFEDGYLCKEIPEYAFYGAPFESVQLTCERVAGIDPKSSKQWYLPDNGWGIRTIGEKCFYEDKNLHKLKIVGTTQSYGEDCFGYKVDDYNSQLDLYELDIFDMRVSPDQKEILPEDFMIKTHFNPNHGPFPAGITPTIYMPSCNTTDYWEGAKSQPDFIKYQNHYINWLNQEPITTFEQFDSDIGSYKVQRQYINVDSFEKKPTDVESADSLTIHNKVFGNPYILDGKYVPIKLNIDLKKWQGNLPEKTRLFCDAEFNPDTVIVNRNGIKLLPTIDYEVSGKNINFKIKLSKDDVIKFDFLTKSDSQTQMIFTSQAE